MPGTNLQSLADESSDSSKMVTFTNVTLSLFAIMTLVSQSAMDLFSGLFVLSSLILISTRTDYRAWMFRRTGFEWVAGAWFLATLASLIGGAGLVPDSQWRKLLDFRWLVIAVLVGRHLGYIRIRERTLIFHGIAFSLASLWAILIFVLGYDPLQPGVPLDAFADGTVRTGGFLQQAIVFAQLYGLWLMLPLGLVIEDLPRLRIIRADSARASILTNAIVLGSIAILLSFTRGIWIAVPLATLVCLSARRWTWALLASLTGAIAVIGMMQVWSALNDRILQAFQGGDSERVWIWTANWEIWKSSPLFGVGYNQNVQLLPEFYEKIQAPSGLLISHAHNQFLHILAGTGLFGITAYTAFWSLILYQGFQTYRRLDKPYLRGLGLGVIGATTVFLFGGAFESNFEHAKMRLTLALIIGLLIYLKDQLDAVPRK